MHLVAAFQGVADGHVLTVHLGTHALIAQVGVDAVGEIEHGGAFGEFVHLAFGGEHVDFVGVEVHLEVVHQAYGVGLLAFQDFADAGKHFVEAGFAADAFVLPVGGQPAFGDFIHAAGTDLDFDPAPLLPHHGDVQGFVAVRLRNGQPVLEPGRVGGVHVGDDGVHLPAGGFFLGQLGVEDDADGEEVVDILKGDFLLLQLVPDGADGLGPAFDVKLQVGGFFDALAHGLDEVADVGIPGCLGFIEFAGNFLVDAALEVFHGQVFELCLDGVQPHAVGQRREQVGGLPSDFLDGVFGVMLKHAHGVQPVGYHDEDHAAVLGEREQQVAEVFGLDGGVPVVEFVGSGQAFENGFHRGAEGLAGFIGRDVAAHHHVVEHRADHRSVAQAHLGADDRGRVQVADNGVGIVVGALQVALLDGFGQDASHGLNLLNRRMVAGQSAYGAVQAYHLHPFFLCKKGLRHGGLFCL